MATSEERNRGATPVVTEKQKKPLDRRLARSYGESMNSTNPGTLSARKVLALRAIAVKVAAVKAAPRTSLTADQRRAYAVASATCAMEITPALRTMVARLTVARAGMVR